MTTRPAAQQLQKIQAQLKQIQASWPLDPLRLNQPDLQISNAISNAIHRVTSNQYQTPLHDVDKRTIEGAARMLASLENLSNGSIAKKVLLSHIYHCLSYLSSHFFSHLTPFLPSQFPLPQSLRNPASFPRHYEELNEGVERAIRGESLPWYRRWIRFT